MKETNPYAPPDAGARASETLPFPLDWKRFRRVFAVSTVAIFLWFGAMAALQSIYALRPFDAEGRVGGLVAAGAQRELGPVFLMTAAMFALIITMHRQSAPSGSRLMIRQLLPFLFALPIITPVASWLMVLPAFPIADQLAGVPFHATWTSIDDFVALQDVSFGLIHASVSTPVFVVVAPFAIRLTFAKPRRLRFKLLAAFLASGVITYLASIPWRVVLESFLLPADTTSAADTVPSVEPMDLLPPAADGAGSQAD